MTILAIDPGDKQSAYCFIDSEDLRPLRFGKEQNAVVLLILQLEKYDLVVIERLASYGMPVGRNVFETCEWVGRFTQAAQKPVDYIYRQDEKLHLCHDSRAKDANIRRALIDRFATHDLKNGMGILSTTSTKTSWMHEKRIWPSSHLQHINIIIMQGKP